MKSKVKQILSVIVVVCLCAGSLYGVSRIVERKASVIKYKPFFEAEQDYEVLFLGTSRVINGIFPMELWKDYGITSYNMGGHANTIPATYWMMMNALDYTTPELVVLDCCKISDTGKMDERMRLYHPQMDAFPLTKTKYSAIKDLLGEETRMEFLWPFTLYHNRWYELTQEDFAVSYTTEKGAESRIDVFVPQMRAKLAREDKFEGDSVGLEYFGKIIEECKKRDIEVLLTYMPSQAKKYKQREANRAYDLAREYDVNYINFMDMDIVDYTTDYYDQDHLNPAGARKVTDYLGKYMMEHYELEDLRKNKAYESWNEDYKKYADNKKGALKAQEKLTVYLMLLKDENYNHVITMNDQEIWNVPLYKKLLENLGYEPETTGSEEMDGKMHILVTDKEDGSVVDNVLVNYQTGGGGVTDITITRP